MELQLNREQGNEFRLTPRINVHLKKNNFQCCVNVVLLRVFFFSLTYSDDYFYQFSHYRLRN